MEKYIFKSSGFYLGFISNSFIFSQNGVYLGWIDENKYVWDKDGKYRGSLSVIESHQYVLRYQYTIPPIPRAPKAPSPTPTIPPPMSNIAPVVLPIGFEDAF